MATKKPSSTTKSAAAAAASASKSEGPNDTVEVKGAEVREHPDADLSRQQTELSKKAVARMVAGMKSGNGDDKK